MCDHDYQQYPPTCMSTHMCYHFCAEIMGTSTINSQYSILHHITNIHHDITSTLMSMYVMGKYRNNYYALTIIQGNTINIMYLMDHHMLSIIHHITHIAYYHYRCSKCLDICYSIVGRQYCSRCWASRLYRLQFQSMPYNLWGNHHISLYWR